MSNQKNILFTDITISVPNKTLIANSDLKITYARKYGLVGRNGSGKSTLLKYISERKIPIDKSIDIFYVTQELDFDPNKTIFQIVSDAHRKKNKLLNKLDELTKQMENDNENDDNENDDNENDDNNMKIMEEYTKTMEKLNLIDYAKDESIIRKILFGLGFEHEQQDMKFSQFSGGWKMRVALARGLYMKPILLLLDEPTNHLDLNSVIWLTDYLVKSWKKSLIIVSHDIHFLNEICTDMIHLENNKIQYYKGNYDMFKNAYGHHKRELENEWTKIQRKVKEMQKKNAPKLEVTKFLEKNIMYAPIKPYKVNIKFPQAGDIKWPSLSLLDITFGYENKPLFENINLSLFENEKMTIVGKNGVGKSTLLEIIMGNAKPLSGEIIKDSKLRIGYYNQHLSDILPNNKTPIEFLLAKNKNLRELDTRKLLGSVGLVGKIHTQKLGTLSGGQRARVVIALICAMNPHILLLDEPTNHLDIESIESFIEAINNFNGAVIMITHNIDVIQKTNSKILKLNNKTLNEIDFDEYYDDVLLEIYGQ